MHIMLLLLALYPLTPATNHVANYIPSNCSNVYTVQPGDYLSRISPNWQYVAQINNIANPNLIYPKQKLCIGTSGSSQETAQTIPVAITTHTGYHPNIGMPGSCVWYVFNQRPDFYIPPTPYAMQFAWVAARNGYRIGYTPAIGAIVIFQPGVQGASSMGHAAIVRAVYGNGSFLIEEMSGPAGPWATDYRTVWLQSGEAFIY